MVPAAQELPRQQQLIMLKIKNELNTETIAHLSCLYNSKADIDRILNDLNEKGVEYFGITW